MKRINFLSVAIVVVLMVSAVSCTTMQGASDDYYTDNYPMGNRIYVDDPYRGTVVLEKDPYTGRYYEVSPYGYSPNSYRSSRNSDYYRNNHYRNYRNYGNYNTAPAQNQQRVESDRKREEARRKVLGN